METQLFGGRALLLAQSSDGDTGLLFAMLFFTVMVYAYFAVSLSTIARKTGTEGGWMAWFPILSAYLWVKCADRPGWWLLLIMFVPIANIVCPLLVWLDIAERRRKSTGLGIFVWIFPVFIGLLASGD